jgi:C4-dicarboxylate-specific signal transduction histidine kinase
MGELTASIAHEINQPLGAILSNADAAELMLRSGCASPEALRDILADIRRDDLRAHEVIRRLRGLLEKREIEHSPISLHAALREVLSLIEPEARERGIALEVHLNATDDQLVGDAIQLQQVLLNLAMNAMDAMDTTPVGLRRLSVTTTETAQEIELSVADSGVGIQPANLGRVFDSFYTTKPDGMGLGLPIVRAIVEAHQGSITAQLHSEGGALMQVRLPKQRHAQSVTPRIPTELSAGSSA